MRQEKVLKTNAIYSIGAVNLHVIYKEGSPAPYANNENGVTSHLKAIEQTVISWAVNE